MSNNALDAIKAMQAKNAAATNTTETVAFTPQKQEEKTFQEYRSSRVAVRIITDKGIQCIFNNGRFFTDDPDVILFLDTQIKKAPMLGVTRGELVTSEDRDPNVAQFNAMKNEMREQLRAELMAELAGEKKDFGNYIPAAAGSGATDTSNMIGSQNL